MCLLRCRKENPVRRGQLVKERGKTTYEKEHDGARIVQLVHCVEVGHAVDIADVNDSEVFDALGDLVENLVLAHAVGVVIAPEANHDESLVFRQDCLVDMPTGLEVGENDGTHFESSCLFRCAESFFVLPKDA